MSCNPVYIAEPNFNSGGGGSGVSDHTKLSNIGVYPHTQIDEHLNNTAIHVTSADKANIATAYNHTGDTAVHVTAGDKTNIATAAAHAADETKHVSTGEKTNWDAAYTHVSDGTVHVTAGEKTNIATAAAHAADGTKHVSAGEKTNWDAAYTHVSDGTVHVTAGDKTNIATAAAHAADGTKHVTTGDKDKWNSASTKSIQIQIVSDSVVVDTSTGVGYFFVPQCMNGMNLIRATAMVATAGTTNATTIQIRNLTKYASNDSLSAAISIASGGTIATAGTIDTAYDDVSTNDKIKIYVTAASTTNPRGLWVVLEFNY